MTDIALGSFKKYRTALHVKALDSSYKHSIKPLKGGHGWGVSRIGKKKK